MLRSDLRAVLVALCSAATVTCGGPSQYEPDEPDEPRNGPTAAVAIMDSAVVRLEPLRVPPPDRWPVAGEVEHTGCRRGADH